MNLTTFQYVVALAGERYPMRLRSISQMYEMKSFMIHGIWFIIRYPSARICWDVPYSRRWFNHYHQIKKRLLPRLTNAHNTNPL